MRGMCGKVGGRLGRLPWRIGEDGSGREAAAERLAKSGSSAKTLSHDDGERTLRVPRPERDWIQPRSNQTIRETERGRESHCGREVERERQCEGESG